MSSCLNCVCTTHTHTHYPYSDAYSTHAHNNDNDDNNNGTAVWRISLGAYKLLLAILHFNFVFHDFCVRVCTNIQKCLLVVGSVYLCCSMNHYNITHITKASNFRFQSHTFLFHMHTCFNWQNNFYICIFWRMAWKIKTAFYKLKCNGNCMNGESDAKEEMISFRN